MAEPAEGRSLMKQPADFTGTNVEGFLLKTALYIEGNPSKFPDEKSRVIFTLSLMEGKAAIWVENFVEEAISVEPHNYGTTEILGQKLQEAFGDPNRKQTAQVELSQLKQGSMTAAEFFSQFDIARRRAGHGGTTSDPYLIELLERNLNERLVDKIMEQDCPDNYLAWKTKAQKLDVIWCRRQAIKADHRKGASQVHQKSQQQTQTPAQTLVTQKDSTGVTFGGAGQAMDIDKAKALGLCFKCGQRGHIGRFCPNKKTARVQQVEEVATTGVTEAARPPDPNELILRQLPAFGEMFKGFSDRLSKMETQGFGNPQQ